MRFTSTSAKQRDKHAKQIPSDIFFDDDLFCSELPYYLLPLMDVDDTKNLVTELQQIAPQLTFLREKKIAWIVIALTHPKLLLSELKEVTSVLNLSDTIVFQLLATLGDLPRLNDMIKGCTDRTIIENMIKADNFYAFLCATKSGHLETLKRLEALTPELVQDMFAVKNFCGCWYAFEHEHYDVCKHIFQQSSTCFSLFEPYLDQYGSKIVFPFIKERLASLRQEASNTPANEGFDITNPEYAKLCFFIIRHLIRYSDTADDIRFLLNIPSVKALAHMAFYNGRPNELLMLAIQLDNQEAMSILLTVPEVSALALKDEVFNLQITHVSSTTIELGFFGGSPQNTSTIPPSFHSGLDRSCNTP